MSDTINCPNCGDAASGNFCASCGTSLGGRFCNSCGSKVDSDSRFCSECGATVGAAPAAARAGAAGASGSSTGSGSAKRSGGSGAGAPRHGAQAAASTGGNPNLGWWMAAAMMVVVTFFMVRPIIWPEEPAGSVQAPFASGGAAAGGQQAVTDLSSMTPREAADRLYDRVMRSAAGNDTAQVTMFLPMSIQAYDMARPLDADGFFHMSRLQRMADQNQAALASAIEGLAENDRHLLNLYAAADAALALGNADQARGYSAAILQAWDAETATDNQDYALHAGLMGEIRGFAEVNAGG